MEPFGLYSEFPFGRYSGKTIHRVFEGSQWLPEQIIEGLKTYLPFVEITSGLTIGKPCNFWQKIDIPGKQNLIDLQSRFGISHNDLSEHDEMTWIAVKCNGYPEYIEWCIQNVQGFCLSQNAITQLHGGYYMEVEHVACYDCQIAEENRNPGHYDIDCNLKLSLTMKQYHFKDATMELNNKKLTDWNNSSKMSDHF